MTEPNKFTKEELDTTDKVYADFINGGGDPLDFPEWLNNLQRPADLYFERFKEFAEYCNNFGGAEFGDDPARGAYPKFRELFPELGGLDEAIEYFEKVNGAAMYPAATVALRLETIKYRTPPPPGEK